MEKPIALKAWKDYSQDEKETLLFHWWTYYGKMLVTLKDMDDFMELAHSSADTVWSIAVVSFLAGMGPEVILVALRQGTLIPLINRSTSLYQAMSSQAQILLKPAEDSLLSQIVKTYNDPEPSVPFTDEEIRKQLEQMTGKKDVTYVKVDLDELEKQL